MDNGSWMPAQGKGDLVLTDANDWRTELSAQSRQRIVNKIMETLKRHLPAGDPDGLSVLTKIAVRFEEKIFTNAENQVDYLRKISLKMLTMETKSAMGNSMASNPIGEKHARSCVDNGGWIPAQGEGGLVLTDANDWRTELSADSRQRIVDKILETLKRHFPAGDPVGLYVLTTIAAIFEQKIFTNAENQADYLGKISLKMLTLETESSMGNSTASNPTGEKPKYARSRMDKGGWMHPQGEGDVVLTDANDWRTELSVDLRQRIVNKILDTLKRHFPAGDPVGLSVLTTVAALFEEKIFTSAENQADYLRKISLKMPTMETKSAMWNSTASNPTREKRKFARSSMDNGGWMPAQDEGNLVLSDANDWRTELSADSRQRIVNMIMETLKRHLPAGGCDGLSELRKIAARFEEKMFTIAENQADYLRKISLKMLTMETKSAIENSMTSNPTGENQNMQDQEMNGFLSHRLGAIQFFSNGMD
ncbi:hypothetical protein AMTRI_Chr06g198320 [Amborella trichopoda]